MEKEHLVVDLYRKVICSLACIEKRTSNDLTRNKALSYINQFIDQYDQYLNKKECLSYNISDLIDFCNDCYNEVEVFDYAEDVEYGVKELIKKANNERGR